MKEQDKTPEKLSESGDRQTSRKIIQNNDSEDDPGSRKRMEARIKKTQEMFNKDLEELKNKQTEMNNIKTAIKNSLEGINSRLDDTEE